MKTAHYRTADEGKFSKRFHRMTDVSNPTRSACGIDGDARGFVTVYGDVRRDLTPCKRCGGVSAEMQRKAELEQGR